MVIQLYLKVIHKNITFFIILKASENGNVEVMKILLKKGADINHKGLVRTALM